MQNGIYLTINLLNLAFFSFLVSNIPSYSVNDITSNDNNKMLLGLELSNKEEKQIIVLGLALIVLFFKLVDWNINNKITIYSKAIKSALISCSTTLIFTVIFIILVTFCTHIVFGISNNNFDSFPKAFIKIIFMLIGSFDYESLSEINAIWCIIILILVIMIDLLILSNIFFIFMSFFIKKVFKYNNIKYAKLKPLDKKSIINWIIFPLNHFISEEEENKVIK